MQKHVLVLTASAVILAWGTITANTQEVIPPTTQQPQILQQEQQLERQLQGVHDLGLLDDFPFRVEAWPDACQTRFQQQSRAGTK
jgi:hypothetical protein